MLRPLVLAFATVSLVACGSGETTSTGPAPTGSSTSSTAPAAGDGGKRDGSSEDASLGPSCTAYVACCKELAISQPQLAAGCDAVQKQLDSAQSSGVSAASYESACKSSVASIQSAGYCK